MFGHGIVCGCSVYSLDDLSVFIDSGLAIDGLGREIVVDTSVVRKLSAIRGFEEITGDRVALCLRYKEEQVHPVYSVNRSENGSEYEYNRIQEGYELFLRDADLKKRDAEWETEFLTKTLVYQDEDYEIQLVMPATVCRNRYVKIRLNVKKISKSGTRFSFEGKLQMPSFLAGDGSHDLFLSLPKMRLMEGEVISQEYWVFVQNTKASETSIMLKKDSTHFGGEEKAIDEDISVKVAISDITPRELVNREIGKTSLEAKNTENIVEDICLAEIYLLRTEGAYVIEKIEEKNVKNYIETPALSNLRSEFLDFFRGEEHLGGTNSSEMSADRFVGNQSSRNSGMQIATGTIEIPVGGKAKPGEVFFSGEVMHGLGAGTVYVEIGQEFMDEDRVKGANTKSTVFGNSRLFAQAGMNIPKTEKAVKVLNDKGSFIAAISFAEETDCLMISYRWVAVKFAGNDTMEVKEDEKQWIEAETPTVVLGTRESYYFGVKFHDMEKCSIHYQVTEEDSGQISVDGVYTAPNKEGVYEIMMSCMEHPHICTYAYAIVKKK